MLKIDPLLESSCPDMIKLVRRAEALASSEAPVLICGETGTGKEVLADFIVRKSKRVMMPYIKINCAAIPESLAESELFGHEKGAYTGSSSKHTGKFEQANGGTVLLDDVVDFPVSMQVKMLRVLDGQPFARIGGENEIRVDVRIISTTNIDPALAINLGKLRSDFYFRLAGAVLRVPPLRERGDDVALLASRALDHLNRVNHSNIEFDEEFICSLKTRNWTGNVRELLNCVQNFFVSRRFDVQIDDLFVEENVREMRADALTGEMNYNLRDNEVRLITEALKKTGWVQKKAAALLGITPRDINYKIRIYGIKHDSWKVYR